LDKDIDIPSAVTSNDRIHSLAVRGTSLVVSGVHEVQSFGFLAVRAFHFKVNFAGVIDTSFGLDGTGVVSYGEGLKFVANATAVNSGIVWVGGTKYRDGVDLAVYGVSLE
jgi:hypothetical protein